MDSDDPTARIERLIDFERADVITPMIHPPRPRLVVSGITTIPMEVSLVPLMYVSRPGYRGIQVVGATGDGGGPRPTQPISSVPFTVELDLAGITGTDGVEVVGETKTERIVVPSD